MLKVAPLSATVTESSPPETNSSSKLFESRLSEHFEASESISPIRSINLAFGLSSLRPPVRVCHCACHLRSFLFRLSLNYHYAPSPSVRSPTFLQHSYLSHSAAGPTFVLSPSHVRGRLVGKYLKAQGFVGVTKK